MNTDSAIEVLKTIKLFSKLTADELDRLSKLMRPQSVEAHANVVIEGELTWGLYILAEGAMGIYKMNKLSSELYDVGQIHSGSFFGEMSLVDEGPRSATVRAMTDSKCYFLSKEDFASFINGSSELKFRFYEHVVRILVGRLRDLNDSYVISQYQLWKTALAKDKRAA